MKRGLPISPGVAVARAFCMDHGLPQQEAFHLDAAALSGEASRFDRACAAVARELDDIIERVSLQVGEDEAAIFRAHRALVRDPSLIGKVTSAILQNGQNAATALKTVVDDYARLFEQIPDAYIRERLADIGQIGPGMADPRIARIHHAAHRPAAPDHPLRQPAAPGTRPEEIARASPRNRGN